MARFELQRGIDPHYDTSKSVVMRYRKSIDPPLRKQLLERVCSREGSRIFHLMSRRGIDIYILDETTRMTTNTFEALVAAVSIARLLEHGRDTAISSSGGNLSAALAAYCQKANIRTFSFVPLANRPLLDGRLFSGSVQLIAVKDAQKTRELMLYARDKLRAYVGYDPLIPTTEDRLAAMRLRGYAVAEFMQRNGTAFSAIAQTVSAGFGPLGMVAALRSVVKKGKCPAFFGVQQEANAYMYRRWKRKHIRASSPLIVPTLFDKNPDKTFGTYSALAALLRKTRGDMVTINGREFRRYIDSKLLQKLRVKGIVHTKKKGELVGRSGLMALAGVLKAIDMARIRDGPVLVCMTDGSQNLSRMPKPSFVAETEADIDTIMASLTDL